MKHNQLRQPLFLLNNLICPFNVKQVWLSVNIRQIPVVEEISEIHSSVLPLFSRDSTRQHSSYRHTRRLLWPAVHHTHSYRGTGTHVMERSTSLRIFSKFYSHFIDNLYEEKENTGVISRSNEKHRGVKPSLHRYHLTVFLDSPASKQCPGPLGRRALTCNRSSPTMRRKGETMLCEKKPL